MQYCIWLQTTSRSTKKGQTAHSRLAHLGVGAVRRAASGTCPGGGSTFPGSTLFPRILARPATLHLLASSKKDISAHQLRRNLGISCKGTWFVAMRLDTRPRGVDRWAT